MTQRQVHPTSPLLVALCAAASVAGCSREAAVRQDDIRTYTVAATSTPRAEASRPATARVQYDVPEGWSDRGPSGMRLATLAIGEPADGLEVTVIPATGSLQGNVERWQGQLDAAADAAERTAAVERALAAAETIDVAGSVATVVTLFDAAAAAGPEAEGQAILAAMIPVAENSSLFVKFKGAAAVARRERDAFVRFVSSLRWQ